jgi:ferric-dicitrate binding protein FerR (iron transport regulator)
LAYVYIESNNREEMKSTRQIKRLLEIWFSGQKLDSDMTDIVRGWLASGDSREEKEAHIKMFFDRCMNRKRRRNAEDDSYVSESLARLHSELGFTDRKIRPKVIPLTRRPSFKAAVATLTAAAVIAGVMLIPRFFETAPYVPAQMSIVAETPKAELITLPDGSTVRLKGGSELTYAENFTENRAVGIDGEAFFSVTRDEAHPFTIDADGITVEVLGTEFNVKAWSDGQTVEVTLADGSVEVRAGESVEVLKPADKAMITRATDAIELTHVEESDILRVRGINLSFHDVTLDEAFAMIADYYGVRIEAADIPHIDGIVVKMEDGATLEQTLFMLQQVNPVFDYRIDGETVTITKK